MKIIKLFLLLIIFSILELFGQGLPDAGIYFPHGPYKQILTLRKYGYFLTDRGVDIYDISDRNSFSFIGSINTVGNAKLIELKNYLLFVMDSVDGIIIYDVSSPYSPDSLATISEDIGAEKIIYQDNKLYAFYDTHVRIYSLSDIRNPILLEDFNYTSNSIGSFDFQDAFVNSHFLIIGFSLGRVIYDMENNFSIIDESSVEFISVTGQNRLLETILTTNNKFIWLDLSTIYSSTVGMPSDMDSENAFLYKNLFSSKGLFQKSANFMIYNASLLSTGAGDVKSISIPDTVLCLAKKDTFLFTGSYRGDTNQIKIFRFSKNRNTLFDIVDSIDVSNRLEDAVNNDSVLIFLSSNSLEFYNIKNPDSTFFIKSLSLPSGSGSEIVLIDSLLYIAMGAGGLYKLNIDDISALSNLSFVRISANNIERVYINDLYLIYYDHTDNKFYFYKKEGSQYSTVAGSYGFADSVYSIAANYKKMYFSTGDKVYALNIENIDDIHEVDHINASTDEFFYKIYFQDDLLSIAAGKAGVKFYLDINSKFLDLNSYTASPSIYPDTTGTHYVYDIYPDFVYFYTPFSGSSIKIVHYGKNGGYDVSSGDMFSLLTDNDSILDFTIDYDNIYLSTFKDSILSWNLNSDDDEVVPSLIEARQWGYGYGDFKKVLSSKNKVIAFSFLFYNYHYVKKPKIVLFSLDGSSSSNELSSISFPDSVVDFDFNDSTLFVGNGDSVNIYSIDDLSNPTLITQLSLYNHFRSLNLINNKLFAADSITLYYYDVTDVNNVVLLDTLSTNFEVKKVKTNGNIVFILSMDGKLYSTEILEDTLADLSIFVNSGVTDFDIKGNYVFFIENDTLKGKSYSTGIEKTFDSDLHNPFSLNSSDLYLILCQNKDVSKIYEVGEEYLILKREVDPYSAIDYGCYNADSIKIILSEGTALRFISADTSNINHIPVFTEPLPDTSIIAFDTLIYKLEAVDPDGDDVTIDFDGSSVPANASLNNDTLVFIPDNSQVGDIQFIFRASDNKGGVTRDTTIVSVFEYKPSPSAFSLISPHEGSIINSSSFDFVWENPMPDVATKFSLIWGDSSNFDTIDNITDTIYHIDTTLTENSKYFWKVIAYNTDTLYFTENREGFVSFYFNQTEEAPNQVIMVYPSSGSSIAEKQPTFKFLKVTDPDPLDTNFVYYFYLSERSDFSTILIEDSIVTDTFSTDTIFYKINKYLLDNRIYYWKVRAKDRAGLFSDFSIYSFMVNLGNDPPNSFNLLSPPNDSVFSGVDSVQITWESTEDPENDPVHYNLVVSNDSSFEHIILDTIINTVDIVFKAPYFTDNTFFYWKVYAIDDKDAERLSKQIYRFIRNDYNESPDIPELYTPANQTVSTLTPTLILTNSTDPDPLDTLFYVFYVYSDNNGNNLVDSSDKIREMNFGQTFYKTKELEDNTQYYWGARAFDKNGDYSDRTSLLPFFVDLGNSNPDDFSLIEPVKGAEFETTRPMFKWHSTTDPDPNDTIVYYQLLIDTTIQFFDPVFNMVDLTDTVFVIPIDLDTGSYYWKVIAYDGHDGTRQTSIWNFRIRPGEIAPSIPLIIAPINDTIVREQNFVITIKNSYDPNPDDKISYDLYISDNSNVITSNPNIYKISADRTKKQTNYTITDSLDDNKHYYMKIRAYDGTLYSDYSPLYSFYLNYNEELPSDFSLINPINDTVFSYLSSIKWNKSIDPDPFDSVTYSIKVLFNGMVFKEIDNLVDTFYIFTDTLGFIDNNQYSIYITAIDKNNNMKNSDTVNVIFDNDGTIPPGEFSLLSPQNNANEVAIQNLQFIWSKSKAYLSNQSIFYKFVLLNSSNDTIFIKSTPDTSLILDNGLLDFDNTYLWSVIAYSYSANQIDSVFSKPVFAIFSTQSLPAGPIVDFNYSIEDNFLKFSWKGNPIQPFKKVIAAVSIYSNELYDTLFYPQDSVYKFLFKNTGVPYIFKFNSYNANNIKSGSPDILLSITDDINLPIVSYPTFNSLVGGNVLPLFLNSLDGSSKSVDCWIKVDSILCGSVNSLPSWGIYPLINKKDKKDGDTIKVEITDVVTKRKNEFQYIYNSSKGINILSNEAVNLLLYKGDNASFFTFTNADTNYCYIINAGPIKSDSIKFLSTILKGASTGVPIDTLNYKFLNQNMEYLNFIFLTQNNDEDSIKIFLFNQEDNNKISKLTTDNNYKVFFEDINKNLDTLEIFYDTTKSMYYVYVSESGSVYWTEQIKTGINEPSSNSDYRSVLVKVYPNPAQSFIKFNLVNYNGVYDINIYDLNGKKVFTKKSLNKDYILKFGEKFSSGIYFYIIKGDKFNIRGKFILVK